MGYQKFLGEHPHLVRVVNAAAYDRVGYIVEYNYGHGEWAIPAWDEWGYPTLAETFKTQEAANAAVWDNLGINLATK